jgi:MATE family multidrug resistance protein
LGQRWNRKGGYRELLAIAIPLIASTGSWTVQHFVDRMFLTWYSPEAIAAAMPAGMLNFTVMSLFLGTAGYVSTFVAQYYGARRYERVGPALWQGVYLALVAGVVHLLLIPLAPAIFGLVGHEPGVRAYEVVYFQTLCYGAAPAIASSALAGFFSGRGRTWPVMWVNVLATALNLVTDYALIFGRWGFPRMGVQGAAIATVLSGCFSFLAYLVLLCRPAHNSLFHTLGGWRFDRPLFARLIRFGFPNGVQFFLDVAGFTAFVFLIGRLGTHAAAASNIAFNINSVAFMPMIGFGIAVSVTVGRYLGENRADLAERSAYSGFHLTFVYMATVAALYVLTPAIFVAPYALRADPAEFPAIRETAVVLLRFVALYSLFDGINIVFAAAIKGAGDTRYVMYMIGILSGVVLVIPSYVALVVCRRGIYTGWVIVTAYVIILAFAFLFRFLGGKWKSMRVIEEALPSLPPSIPETPTTEFKP